MTQARQEALLGGKAENEVTPWSQQTVDLHIARSPSYIQPIAPDTFTPILPGVDLWDSWPIECENGDVARFGSATLWMVLSAPWRPNPHERHSIARIHLMSYYSGEWKDHGALFPDGFSPGSREWSGSAVIDQSTNKVTVFFTATGTQGDTSLNFRQRIFQVTATLHKEDGLFACRNWTNFEECFTPDSVYYLDYDGIGGGPGTIKAFRDPGYFFDPVTEFEYLFFTGTDAETNSPHNGVIGAARRNPKSDSAWSLMHSVVTAAGFNNELERPHMRYVNGLYYLFWSTQSKVFAPCAGDWPTGLYGMVGKSPTGPFSPLNGNGLVAANPPQQPLQAYSFWVMNNLKVASFIDMPFAKTKDAAHSDVFQREYFIGGPAPEFQLSLHGIFTTISGY